MRLTPVAPIGHPLLAALAAVTLSAAAPPTLAQGKTQPPIAQAWIDIATVTGIGMPAGGQMNAAALMGGMMGSAASAEFLNTQHGVAGRWLDVTLRTRNEPNLREATQSVPEGSGLAPTLALKSPDQAAPPPKDDDREVPEERPEKPRGTLKLYWGCGDSVRAGQPKVIDFSTASSGELQKFFTARRATRLGAHSAVGRPHWPQAQDRRVLPERATLVGTHAFAGKGVPPGFQFALPAAQDLMPPIALRQQDRGGAMQLDWAALPTARAYFIAVIGASGREDEMVIWTSSEVPETGFGLIEYQTNAAVDRWLKDKVLLSPATTHCAIPKGIVGEGGMLRMIAYGSELNLAHPPRPTDPKAEWKPDWATKVRVKSVVQTMVGMDPAELAPATADGTGTSAPRKPASAADVIKDELVPAGAADLIKGLFGR